MGMKEHPSLKTFVMDFLQGYRWTGYYILGKALPGAFIENTDAIIYTEARVLPGEHVSGKPFVY
jgi:hypothetical protein